MICDTRHFKLLPNNQIQIDVAQFKEEPIVIATETIKEMDSLARLKYQLKKKLGRKDFIKIQIGKEKRLVKVKDLAKQLGLTRSQVLKIRSGKELQHLIETAVESKHYQVPLKTIDLYEQEGRVEDLHYFEYLSDSLGFSVAEFVEAQRNGKLEDLLQEINRICSKCEHSFKKLDELYLKNEGKFTSKDDNEYVISEMTPADLALIKKTMILAYKTFENREKDAVDTSKILRASFNHSVLVEQSKDELKITGLFGKCLGDGGEGVAVQTIDLISGEWSEGKESVLKIPKALDFNSEHTLREAEVLDNIHKNGNVLGIQKPLRVIRDVFRGDAAHCHLGPRYEGDLFKVVTDSEEKPRYNLKLEDRFSVIYQLLHGLFHMHKMEITHGDIKLPNIFVSQEKNSQGENYVAAFLGDFGGSVDHRKEKVSLQETTSSEYRSKADTKASQEAFMAGDLKSYLTIEKKADVFAMCSVIGFFFTGDYIYNLETFDLMSDAKERLLATGLSEQVAEIVLRGLDLDYHQRPDVEEIFNLFKQEALQNDTPFFRWLISQSSC